MKLIPIIPAKFNIHNVENRPVSFTSKKDTFSRLSDSKTRFSLEDFQKYRKKLTISQFRDLSFNEREEIETKCPQKIKEAAEDNRVMARKIKRYLDEKYTENGYVFVSIGTSPASVGRAMEFMGVETKYLPVSGLKNAEDYKEILKYDLDNKYYKFIEKQHLDAKSVSGSNKTFLFFDYRDSGKSLAVFEDLMLKGYKLPKEKTVFNDISAIIYKACPNKEKADEFIGRYLLDSVSQKYAGIPHLDFTKLKKVDETIKQYTNENCKYYNFYLMKMLENYGILSESSLNNSAA